MLNCTNVHIYYKNLFCHGTLPSLLKYQRNLSIVIFLCQWNACGMSMHFETTTSTITTVNCTDEIDGPEEGRICTSENVGELRPPQADLSGSGWGLVDQAMRAAADGK
jgi:hypothetical protein